eukprot:GHVH01011131.1.p1 GENE.GHVH01011131.1~~GHVH01011131.1.p1  ORF type:complete len:166 (+),score=39.14 GHVH01011131.1:60-500(+)
MATVDKKIRKTFEKAGLVSDGVYEKVTLRLKQSVSFEYKNSEVFVSPSGWTRVVIGQPRFADPSSDFMKMAGIGAKTDEAVEAAPAAPVDDGEVVDLGDFAEDDVTMVCAQGGCSKKAAVEALKATSGDVVEAIMHVTDGAPVKGE